jgi:hypothetical protein
MGRQKHGRAVPLTLRLSRVADFPSDGVMWMCASSGCSPSLGGTHRYFDKPLYGYYAVEGRRQ